MQKMFGFHYGVSTPEGLQSYVDAARDYLAPAGINYAIIEICDRFVFTAHPECSSRPQDGITAEALRKACDAFRSLGIEPVPLYNCMGHQGWSTRNALLKAHPELEEAPWIPDENLIQKPHVHDGEKWIVTDTPAWCGNEPKVWDYVLDCIDELIEASGCKYFHVGMDEIFLLGQCERCKGMDPADLYLNTMLRLHKHITGKGLKMMIWGDRLLDGKKLISEELGKTRIYDYEFVGTSACISRVPKDIIVCDWHYWVDESFPSPGELLDHDLITWPSCWFDPDAADGLWLATEEQAKERGKLDLVPGVLITGWDMSDNLWNVFAKPEEELPENQQMMRETVKRMAAFMDKY